VIAPAATPRCPVYGAGIASNVGAQEYFATVGPTSLAPFPNPFTNTTLHKLGDDYDASGVGTGGFIKLETFRFVGGVTDGGSSRISFEFYDVNGNFVEDIFFISSTNTGTVQVVNVLALAPTLKIPDRGFVVAHVLQAFGTPTARSEMFWLSTDTTDQGTNDPNTLYIANDLGTPSAVANFLGVCAGGDNDGLGCSTVGGSANCPGGTCNSVPGVLAFELEGDKTVDGPSGACCDGTSAGCNELLVWECRGMGTANYLGDGVACASCSNDSALPGNACRTCSDTGIACTGAVDCPTGTCDLNDLLCRQCDDFITPCSQDADCTGIGSGLCGPGSCQLAASCGLGSCCIAATGECQDGHTAASCGTLGGTFNGLGSDCDPNCCVQPPSSFGGSDNCETAVATTVTVPSGTICQGGTNDGLACTSIADCGGNPCERAATVTVTGDNSTDSSTFASPDSCIQPSDTPGSELGWYEKITIVDPATRPEDTIGCAFLRVDHCCTAPVKIPAFRILYDACPCGDNIFTKSNPNFPLLKADARGAPFCPLDNAWQQFGPLRAGDYWYPIFSQLGGNFDQYQFHIHVDACPDAVCCTGSNCNVVNVLECEAAGGTFLAPPNLSVGQTFCSGQCNVGSCCTGPGECVDNQIPGMPPVSFVAMDQPFCENSLTGTYVGGIRCLGGTCAGGQQAGQSCSVDGDCPNSTCIGDTLALSQPSPCPVCENIGPNNCQRNDDSVVQRGSDLGLPGGGVHVADDFIPLTPTISTVCTWGVYTASDGAGGAIDCGTEALQDNFRVRVYGSTANGLPDVTNVVAEVMVAPADSIRAPIANSASELLGNSVLYAYQFDLSATPITGLDTSGATIYWLEIANTLDGVCSWSWQTVDTQNNDYSASGGAGQYGPSSARSRDMAFCLSTDFDPGPQPVHYCCACDGTCAEKTLRDCQTDISRWRVGDSCSDTVCEAGPPPNDLCGPVADMVITPVLAGTVRFDNTCSNADGINSQLQSESGAVAQISGDIWYTYIATDSGTVTFSTCPVGAAAGGGIDTILAVYRDDTNPTVCSCNASDAEMIARTAWYTEPPAPANTADENCDGVLDGAGGFISGEASAGDCFLIRVGGFPGQGSEEGAGTITITLEAGGGPTPPPAEDVSSAGDHGQRYLEIATPGSTGPEVIRVKPMNIPDLTGGADVLYLGTPFDAPDPNSVDGSIVFTASRLGCDPVATDFSAFTSIAVYGAEITPSTKTSVAQYSVQRAMATCPNLTTDEACWSTPLIISQGVFGDVVVPFLSVADPVQPDFLDVLAYVDKFVAKPTALPKTALELVQNIPRPLLPVDFLDIGTVLGAFGGGTYANAPSTKGLCTCPSSVTCGATACSIDIDCSSDGICLEGFCTDKCGRCAP